MADWAELEQELALWRAADEVPTFWWRDDDTQAPTDDLDRLIQLAERFEAPLHLAVIPADIDAGLAGRLGASPLVYVMQHGFCHKNHEPKGTRASEVGEIRDIALQKADLREGWQRLRAAGLPNLLPVFVPPWNRIAEKTIRVLPELGFVAYSGFYRRRAHPVAAGLIEINGHIDPIRWKEGATFSGTEKTLEQCVQHLRQRRTGEAHKDEATGLVTHHLQTDEATWAFCEAFMDRITHLQNSRWMPLPALLEQVNAGKKGRPDG